MPDSPRLTRHADHDPSLTCRPALGYGLCEVLGESSSDEGADSPLLGDAGGDAWKSPQDGERLEMAATKGSGMSTLFEISAADVAMTNDEWYTPRWIFDAAGLTFDLDVCAPVAPEFRTCPARRYLTILDDGLTAPWDGLVWMNPPYSNPAPWVDRFAAHPDGLALVPAASSLWRGRYLKASDGIALLSVTGNEMRAGRGFGRPNGSQASYPVALILAARGELAVKALEPVAMADPYAGGAYHVRPGSGAAA